MYTTERIVESYFRICKSCFTVPDVKVPYGNNRQLDLLAYSLIDDLQFHVEVGVTHCERFAPSLGKLTKKFEHKFFGEPREKDGNNTDHARGKNYLAAIRKAYTLAGFNPAKVKRVWVCWKLPEGPNFDKQLRHYCRRRRLGKNVIKVVSFRDTVIPELMKHVGTANYEDDVLRTLSLIRQGKVQSNKAREKSRQTRFVKG